MHRLVTIKISHYNEKARWVLDRYSVPYREHGFMPLLHAPLVVAASLRYGTGRPDRASTRLSTPYLITDDGRGIPDSGAIARYVSDRYAKGALYPCDDVATLEQELHDKLGPHARRIAYFYLFRHFDLFEPLASRNVGRLQTVLTGFLLPAAKPLMQRALNLTPTAVERSKGIIRDSFRNASRRLGDRKFLVGNAFTAADLSFACMASPVLVPSHAEGYGAVLPAVSDLPSEYRQFVDELRDTTAGRFALRMFAEERGSTR